MRITGGEARGRAVVAPKGLAVRPTGSKVRQALFNILGGRIHEARFLDVCAGTGLMGLEALSRGAGSLISVEENRQAVKAIEESIKLLGYDAEVIAGDFRQVLPVLEPRSFDMVFADPPYSCPFINSIPLLVDKFDLLDDGGVLVIEHLRSLMLPDEIGRLQRDQVRNYGQTSLSFFSAKK